MRSRHAEQLLLLKDAHDSRFHFSLLFKIEASKWIPENQVHVQSQKEDATYTCQIAVYGCVGNRLLRMTEQTIVGGFTFGDSGGWKVSKVRQQVLETFNVKGF